MIENRKKFSFLEKIGARNEMILHEMWKKGNYNYNIWYKLIISLRNIINIIFLEFFEKEPYKKSYTEWKRNWL